jgi:thiamine-monophosphate kinase
VLGEFDLIALLRERVEAAGAPAGDHVILGPGDDAAVTLPRGATATSVDAMVEGVHFRRETFPPEAIGHKALAVALSDLAAMGAAPGEAYVQVGVPDDLRADELAAVADGLGSVARSAGVAIAGGDVVRSPALWLAVTVVGHAEASREFVRRGGASPGDALVLTGPVGGAAAGLLLLERPELASALDAATADRIRDRQLRPSLRLEAGRALASAGASAMIDVSDGLAADAGHVAAASGVLLRVELTHEVLEAGVEQVAAAAGLDPLDLVAGGGEDYELLAAVPQDSVKAALEAVRATGFDPATVGRVEDGEGAVLSGPTGREVSDGGYDQLRPPAPAGPSG